MELKDIFETPRRKDEPGEGVDLQTEQNVLRQEVYNLRQEVDLLNNRLCFGVLCVKTDGIQKVVNAIRDAIK